MRELAKQAESLRDLHARQLVLANAWDRPTAQLVESLGFPVVATTSHAVAALNDVPDADVLDPSAAFSAIAEIVSAVTVPVTADIEAGYQLNADDIIARLLDTGAVGCNIEDSAHHDDTALVDADVHADRIAAIRDSATSAGVNVVINARVDSYLHAAGNVEFALEDTIARGRAYRDAGADCVYPILVSDAAHIDSIVKELGCVNVLAGPGIPAVRELFTLGVARVSVGAGLFAVAMDAFGRSARRLRNGEDWW